MRSICASIRRRREGQRKALRRREGQREALRRGEGQRKALRGDRQAIGVHPRQDQHHRPGRDLDDAGGRALRGDAADAQGEGECRGARGQKRSLPH
jgi:hypothetical protein